MPQPTLTLRIIHFQGASPAGETVKTFDGQGGTLGRAADNDWVLADPRHFLSRKHAAIHYRDGNYYITDTSRNGIYIDDTLVGKGISAPLQDGQTLALGEYEIAISLQPEQAGAVVRAETPDLLTPIDSTQQGRASSDGSPADRMPVSETPRDWSPDDSVDLRPVEAPDRPIPGQSLPPEQEHFTPPEPIPEDWEAAMPGPAAEPPPLALPPFGPSPQPSPQPSPLPIAVAGTPSEPKKVGSEMALLQAFLDGAGMPALDLSSLDEIACMGLLGEMFREMLTGLLEILIARAEIKREFRMDVTTIRPVENNPLKFSVNAQEALYKLLIEGETSGYLPPAQAVREAFGDIKAHQIATIAGMEGALKTVFQRFDPKALEQSFGKGTALDSLIPSSRKAKYWGLFNTRFQQLAREAEEDFQRLFGEAFATAYQRQIEKLEQDQS